MKYRIRAYAGQLFLLYFALRLAVELIYGLYCLASGAMFDKNVLQSLKFIGLGVAVVLMGAVYWSEWNEIKELAIKTDFSFDAVAYARFRMNMSHDSISEESDLDDRVERHKKA